MQRVALLLLVVGCAAPMEPDHGIVTVSVVARDSTVGGQVGCVGRFTITTRAGPELTFVSVAALSQDNAIWTTTVRYFPDSFVVDGGFQPEVTGQINAARFSYYGTIPQHAEIPVQHIEAPCGTTVRREHQ